VAGPLAEHLELIPSSAGLHLTATFRTPVDDVVAERRAMGEGVAVQALSRFRLSVPTPPGLLLGYGAVSTEDIPEGLRRLGLSLEGRSVTSA
jgi:GntR family transcriptional regulator/MocR family aminotransferase